MIKLFAPILPYITEELYQLLYSSNFKSIHSKGVWPQVSDTRFDNIAEDQCENLLEILDLVRKIKAQDSLSIKAPIHCIEISGTVLPNNLVSDLKDVTSSNKIKHVQSLTSISQNLCFKSIQINVIYDETTYKTNKV